MCGKGGKQGLWENGFDSPEPIPYDWGQTET
jgi:hypothetical protein